VLSTVEAIRSLEDHGFLRRYAYVRHGVHGVDGLHGPEGTFVGCSLWFADALAATGRPQEACEMFERVLDIRNDVGLLSEQWDPERHQQLGNTPQAFSHIALVDTAFSLGRSLESPAGASVSARYRAPWEVAAEF
jgi:GH15 family glucan-1,4-alpha-glucosidase